MRSSFLDLRNNSLFCEILLHYYIYISSKLGLLCCFVCTTVREDIRKKLSECWPRPPPPPTVWHGEINVLLYDDMPYGTTE
jgi:hypothetical protein